MRVEAGVTSDDAGRAALTGRAHWLRADRIRFYAGLVLALELFVVVGLALTGNRLSEPVAGNLFADFLAYWNAAAVAASADPLAVYDATRWLDQQWLAGNRVQALPWFYPPTWLLAIRPLGSLPYLQAYAVFMLATLVPFWLVVRAHAGPHWHPLVFFAFPGVALNLITGQNGLLTAALSGAALLWMRSRPVRAGLALALLTFKPQLGVLFPPALLAARRGTVFVVAAAGALLFLALAVQAFGIESLMKTVEAMSIARRFVEDGVLPLERMATFFAAASLLGAPKSVAYLLHFAIAAAAAVAVVLLWRRQGPSRLACAALTLATLLVTPYLFDYDLVLLAVPIAILARDGLERGWLRWEREALAAVWLVPLVCTAMADLLRLQAAPVLISGLLVLVLRRAHRMEPSGEP